VLGTDFYGRSLGYLNPQFLWARNRRVLQGVGTQFDDGLLSRHASR